MFKKYIHYCRSKCGPRLSQAAADKLRDHFVLIRQEAHSQEADSGKRSAIPITVRQLEAIVRISESLAKMQLEPFATEEHVDEALRLFKVSTLDAAMSGNLDGEGMGSNRTLEEFSRIEQDVSSRQFSLI